MCLYKTTQLPSAPSRLPPQSVIFLLTTILPLSTTFPPTLFHPSMSLAATTSRPRGVLTWRPTKIMSINDLPNDDDFLSHLLIEKLGTSMVPLLVHKMDSSRRLPKTNSLDLMRIIRRVRSLFSPSPFLRSEPPTFFYATLCSMLPANFRWRRPSRIQSMSSYRSFTISLFGGSTASDFWHLSCLTILPAPQTPFNTLFSKELYPEANKCLCHVGRVLYVLRRPSFLIDTFLDMLQDTSNFTIQQGLLRSHTRPVTHTAPANLSCAFLPLVISLLILSLPSSRARWPT